MKKTLFLVVAILFISCEKERITNECFRGIYFNEAFNLNNPYFLKLSTPVGYVISSVGGRTVLIIRKSNSYKAFDLQCPESDCDNPMTYAGVELICPCSKKEYNSLNGSPIDGKGCFALEYNVFQNGNLLQISSN